VPQIILILPSNLNRYNNQTITNDAAEAAAEKFAAEDPSCKKQQ
jgi:hypothetical protein